LGAMAFDSSGTKIATTSNKVRDFYVEQQDTLHRRVFVLQREPLFEFIMYPMAHVYLNFVVAFDGMNASLNCPSITSS
jgi:hypothetical protein